MLVDDPRLADRRCHLAQALPAPDALVIGGDQPETFACGHSSSKVMVRGFSNTERAEAAQSAQSGDDSTRRNEDDEGNEEPETTENYKDTKIAKIARKYDL